MLPIMPSSSRIVAGAMSGTSADGVDIALVEITGHGLGMTAKLLHHHARPYETALRQRIFAVRGEGKVALAELAGMGREISLSYAMAVKDALREASLKACDIAAIAAHGQTLFHDPPNTIQWLDPALVAAETECAVVSDFRRADCAAGGQGAPLVPFADYILFRHATKNRLIVNIGGIANATILEAGCAIDRVFAYDTGPGNCISDFICRQMEPDGPGYDAGGDIASRGNAVGELAKAFRRDPYFILQLAPRMPKSTDVPKMLHLFSTASSEMKTPPSYRDTLATACLVSATEIMWAARHFGQKVECELIVSGGGTKNRLLMYFLQQMFGIPRVPISDDFGIPSESKEALAFALLSAATLDGLPSNVPSATGAKRAVVLGSITPKP